jgi:hypothetical protein
MKLWVDTKLEKFGGPLKNLCGPPEGRGLPVENHCLTQLFILAPNREISLISATLGLNNGSFVIMLDRMQIGFIL